MTKPWQYTCPPHPVQELLPQAARVPPSRHQHDLRRVCADLSVVVPRDGEAGSPGQRASMAALCRPYTPEGWGAEAFLAARYSKASVLTAWPASDELSHPYLGYVSKSIRVVKIEDFTAKQLLSAAGARSHFDVALVFSTKYPPPNSFFDHWNFWQEWKSRYFGYHKDLAPEVAAAVLRGNLVYVERKRGQWVGIIEMQKSEEAMARVSPLCTAFARSGI